jgi:hypothetical protein
MTQNHPWHGGARPLTHVNGELGREAAALWATVDQRQSHVAAVEQAARDAEQAAQQAHQALEAERARAADAAEVSTLDAQLLAERDQLIAEASPEIHNPRRHAAAELVQQAETDYLAWLRQNTDALLAALRPACEKVAKDWNAQNDANYKAIRPVEARAAALRDAVQLVAGNDDRLSPDDLPGAAEPQKPPFPVDAVARIAREAAEACEALHAAHDVESLSA